VDFFFKMPEFLKYILPTLLVLFLSVTTVTAAPPDLYVGEAAVGGQDASARNKALPLALLQVLQKLSGLRVFDEYPLLTESLDSADSLLQSCYFRKNQHKHPIVY
jgi:hypothetical protein